MQKNRILIIILILIAVLTHFEWFNFSSTLFDSDWTHWSDSAVKEIKNFGFGTWVNYSGFGGQNIQIFFNLFKIVWGIIGYYDISAKITFFIPIALLSFLSPYFLIRYFTKNNSAAFLVALFFGLNTHLLVKETAHLPLAFLIVFTPILLISFDILLKKLSFKNTLIFSLLYFISICYEIRVTYIVTLVLVIYILIVHFQKLKNRKLYKSLFMFLIIQLTLNSFWFLPTLLGGGTSEIAGVANRGLFGNHLFRLDYALNIFDSAWTGNTPNNDFIPQKIPFYFWFYPLLILISTLFISNFKKGKKQIYLFALLISVIGILLTKQSADPFPQLYEWLYHNFPGFNLFREAGKFYLITLLGYTIILGIFLDYLFKNHKKYFYISGIIIVSISCLIAKPLVFQDMKTVFINKSEPQEYTLLNTYIGEQEESFKIVWAPRASQWGYYDTSKSKTSLIDIYDTEFKDFHIISPEQRDYSNLSSYIFGSLSNTLLDIAGVRYIVVGFQDPQDDYFRLYPSTPLQYYKELKKNSFLKEISIQGISQTKIFENSGYLSPIFRSNAVIQKENIDTLRYSNIKSKQLNPAHYTFRQTLSGSTIINISQKNNNNWNVIVGDFSWTDYFSKEIFLQTKQESLDFLNSWEINSETIQDYVKNHYSQELQKLGYPKMLPDGRKDYKYYIENLDGSIDVELTLYFKPQSYFYLGIIVSVTTFALLILWLIVDSVRNRKGKRIDISRKKV